MKLLERAKSQVRRVKYGLALDWIKNINPKYFTRFVVGTEFPLTDTAQFAEFEVAYQVHPWVFSCVRVVADNAAQVPLGIYQQKKKGGHVIKEPVYDHPLSRLIRKPNLIMDLSEFDLKKNSFGFMELSGNSYWFIVRDPDTGIAGALIPLRPDRVEIVPDKRQFIKGYLYRVDEEVFSLESGDVLHAKYWNPYDEYYGLATLRAGRMTLNHDWNARKYDTAFYKNGARPGGALVYEQTLNEEDYKRVREEWDKGHRGVDNAHRIAILEKGAKYEGLGISQVDMDFINARKLNREELAAIFGVPPVLINSYEHANYNTATTQARIFWRVTMQPKLRMFCDTLNAQIDKLMGPLGAAVMNENLFFDWGLSDVWALQDERKERITSDVSAIQNGVFTRNEVRATYNLPPVEGGDDATVPSGITPLADLSLEPPEEDPPPPPEEEEDSIKALSGPRQRRVGEWKGFVVASDHYERLFRRYVRALLKDQRAEVLRRLRQFAAQQLSASGLLLPADLEIDALDTELSTKVRPTSEADIEMILFNLDKATATTAQTSAALYERIMNAGGRRGFELARMSGVFDLANPRAQKMLADASQLFAQRINETTWTTLKESMLTGVKKGEGIAHLSKRVTKAIDVRAAKRFEIARTEVIRSLNAGTNESFAQSDGAVEQKEWVAAGDEVTRDSHMNLDGDVVPVHSAFDVESVGGEGPSLRFPGDPGGAASEVINCRCTLLPVLKESR